MAEPSQGAPLYPFHHTTPHPISTPSQAHLFIDDMPHNVEGAKAVGIAGVQFKNAAQCEDDLKALGLSF